MEQDKTAISELGEFGLIDRLTGKMKMINKSTIKGVGDDAAVLDYTEKKVLVTTDFLVEGIHFDLTYTPLKHLGYKSVMVNLSDIYAMNGKPRQITVSMAISNKLAIEDIDLLYEGIELACNTYGVDLVGGDTTSSLSGLIISITAIGEADLNSITYRSTAKENDLICVTGDLGSAYMGLQLLEREKTAFNSNPGFQPEFEGFDYILERQLKPEARKDVVEFFEANNILPSAMIDISDGLSSEILHICEQSGTGCKIYEDKLPIHEQTSSMAKIFAIDPTICAMNGGEDYELLFTVPLKYFDTFKNLEGISIIGHITNRDNGKVLITRDGSEVNIQAQGWNSFE